MRTLKEDLKDLLWTLIIIGALAGYTIGRSIVVPNWAIWVLIVLTGISILFRLNTLNRVCVELKE